MYFLSKVDACYEKILQAERIAAGMERENERWIKSNRKTLAQWRESFLENILGEYPQIKQMYSEQTAMIIALQAEVQYLRAQLYKEQRPEPKAPDNIITALAEAHRAKPKPTSTRKRKK